MADEEQTDAPERSETGKKRGGFKRGLKWTGVAVLALAVTGGGYVYYHHGRLHPSTEDAYIQANVVKLAPEVGGRLVKVPVSDQGWVGKGDLLFKIDPGSFADNVDQAEASLADARQAIAAQEAAVEAAKARVSARETAVENARKAYRRAKDLAESNVGTQSRLDDAKSALDEAKAQLSLAKAQLNQAQKSLGSTGEDNHKIRMAKAKLHQAQLQLADTSVEAACEGRLSGFSLHRGDVVNAHQNEGALVCDERFWVYANYKETDLTRIRPGQSAEIEIDMYPDRTFHGIVESIDPASGAAFSLLPPENASGNWVKVTQRVPVKILITDAGADFPLRVQTSAGVTVDTGAGEKPKGRARTATVGDAEAMKLAAARFGGPGTRREASSPIAAEASEGTQAEP